MESIHYTTRDFQGLTIVDLSGNITANTCGIFGKAMTAAIDRDNLVLNMENVSLVTSSGIEVLIDLSFYAKKHEKRIIILWASEELIRMTEVLDVYGYLIFAESVEEARTKISIYT